MLCARTQQIGGVLVDESVVAALGVISGAGVEELKELGRAVEERRRELGLSAGERSSSPVSRLVEARAHQDGWLQAEVRIHRRSDGSERERGPYWYFRYHEGGRQKKLYLGKTDDPEGVLARKRG
jgi:hypothetical protein